MEQEGFDIQKIIVKLRFYRYRYSLDVFTHPDEVVLKIYLPMLCYLKIRYKNNRIKMTSHIRYGFDFVSLEYNMLIYALIFLGITGHWGLKAEPVILSGLFMMIIHFVICFIKIESLRTIVHHWIQDEPGHDHNTDKHVDV